MAYDYDAGTTNKATASTALQAGVTGASVGTAVLPGIGTAVGAGIGLIAGAIAGRSTARNQQRLEQDYEKEQEALLKKREELMDKAAYDQDQIAAAQSAAAQKSSRRGGELPFAPTDPTLQDAMYMGNGSAYDAWKSSIYG
jgi:outer membrane lipoprotein SlyB